ncbi:MAG TPA: hypothetical protein VK712_01560 [Verrucomicrobiae bacterium]|nr:hypothetical protein [Verrucomicrobiae bacterium]
MARRSTLNRHEADSDYQNTSMAIMLGGVAVLSVLAIKLADQSSLAPTHSRQSAAPDVPATVITQRLPNTLQDLSELRLQDLQPFISKKTS